MFYSLVIRMDYASIIWERSTEDSIGLYIYELPYRESRFIIYGIQKSSEISSHKILPLLNKHSYA